MSSSSGARVAQTKCNVSKAKAVNSEKRRKYFDSYLSVDVAQDGGRISPHPVYILYNEILQNNSMVPFELKHHSEIKHSKHKGKPHSFLLNNIWAKFKSENENALMISLKVSYHIALESEVYTMGEKLIKPCAGDLAACVIDEEAAKKTQLVLLSNNIIQRRIQDSGVNVLDEVV